MIARSSAKRRLLAALIEARYDVSLDLGILAARVVDEIYGVDGADAINPRYGPLPEDEKAA